jgi:hypothetical protein
MRALVARKDADFQTLESVWRPSRQMRIAVAVFTAKRFNKYLFSTWKECSFITGPTYSASAGHARHPRRSPRTPPSRSPDQANHGPGGRWQGKGDVFHDYGRPRC